MHLPRGVSTTIFLCRPHWLLLGPRSGAGGWGLLLLLSGATCTGHGARSRALLRARTPRQRHAGEERGQTEACHDLLQIRAFHRQSPPSLRVVPCVTLSSPRPGADDSDIHSVPAPTRGPGATEFPSGKARFLPYQISSLPARPSSGTLPPRDHPLQQLNSLGYGTGNPDLRLNLVYNPARDFLAPAPAELEETGRCELDARFRIVSLRERLELE